MQATATLLGHSALFARRPIPMFLERVAAGFPSPAQDFIEKALDLNELCVHHPAATFFVRVSGDSMVGAGIFPDDILVVDRSLEARQGDIVIAVVDGEFTVKELILRPRPRLIPRNPAYPAIDLAEDRELEIFGVVTRSLRAFRAW